MGLLERLLQAAEAGERTGSVIEILMLQALAHQVQGDIPAALVPLERALSLAEPEGYVRIFVDEGPPMAVLLEKAAKHGIAPNYAPSAPGSHGQGSRTERPSPTVLIDATSRNVNWKCSGCLDRLERPGNCTANSSCPSTPCVPTPKTFTASSGWTTVGQRSTGLRNSICSNEARQHQPRQACRTTYRSFFLPHSLRSTNHHINHHIW